MIETVPASALLVAHQRAFVVREARSWIGTPYRVGARVKAAGCDCATLLYCVLHGEGLLPEEPIGLFQGDWWMHSTEDVYIQRMLRHAGRVAEGVCRRSTKAEPGNIVLTKACRSRVWNHGGIVTEWPRVIHAVKPVVCEIDASADPFWMNQPIVILDPYAGKNRK